MSTPKESAIASLLFRMIRATQDKKLDPDKGFRNQSQSGEITLNWLFLTSEELRAIPKLPFKLSLQVRPFNVLVMLEVRDSATRALRTAGIYLVWTGNSPFSALTSEEDMSKGLLPKNLNACLRQMEELSSRNTP